jgi:2-dehydropantoate 2-reductase
LRIFIEGAFMRILVVGAGATGGYFGGRLAEAGRDVTFLVRPKRAEQLRQTGLQILSPHGDVTLQPHLVTADRIASPYDAVLVTVKAYALDAALDDVAPAVGPATMVVPVLNGMRHVDTLIARFGETSVLGGVCLVATTLDPQGRIKQLAEFQQLVYGERRGEMSARVVALDAVMQGAGFVARASGAILQEMWEKWILLATLGAITCLMRGTVGEIEAAPGGTGLALAAMDECVAVAARSGFAPGEAYLTRTKGMVTAKGSSSAPSMYRDLSQGLPVEADQIVGDMLKRAQGFGIAAPVLTAAYAHLSIYQRRLGAG